MAKYISRKEAINICTKCVEFQDSIENVTASAEAMRIRRLIKELPSADVAEVKYAKDIYMQGKGHCEFKCSLCGAEIGCVEGGDMDGGKFNYCPNCGAKMTHECYHADGDCIHDNCDTCPNLCEVEDGSSD